MLSSERASPIDTHLIACRISRGLVYNGGAVP